MQQNAGVRRKRKCNSILSTNKRGSGDKPLASLSQDGGRPFQVAIGISREHNAYLLRKNG
jgi:hypothetical protein